MNSSLQGPKILGLHNHISSLSHEGMLNFLDECLKSNADIISITDHRTVSSYYKLFSSLTDEQIKKYQKLRFVIGMELTGSFNFVDCLHRENNIVMDILCYNIDLDKYHILWDFIKQKYTSYLDTKEFQIRELKRLIYVAKQEGFKADYDKLEISDKNPFAARVLSYALIDPKYVEYNLQKGLLPEIVKNPRAFFNRYCKIKSPFYLDTSRFFPTIQEVIDVINESGALPFLDHPAAYFPKNKGIKQNRLAWLNSRKFVIDFFKKTHGVRGIEIIHPSCLDEKGFYNFLDSFSKAFHLFVSGGTDYHQNGEDITTDFNGQLITNQRLYNFDKWARLYSIEDLMNIVERINEVEQIDDKDNSFIKKV